jgi:hypothetical protein
MHRPTPRSTLRIGCVPDLRLQPLQALIGALHACDPTVPVEVLHLRSAAQLRRLATGELDLCLVHAAGIDGEVATAPFLRGAPIAVLLPVGHRHAGRAPLKPAQLRDEVLLMFPRAADPGLFDVLLSLASAAGAAFLDVWERGGGDIRDLLLAVASGEGIGLVPQTVLAWAGEAASIVERAALDPPLWMPDTLLAWRSDPPEAHAHVLGAARAAARELHARS